MTYEYFIFLPEWWSFINTLPQEQGTQLIKGIARYGLYGCTDVRLDGSAAQYFTQRVRPNLDKQHAAYRNKCGNQSK